MRFKALPVTSLEDATVDFEQLQTKGVDRINGTLVPLTGAAWVAPTLINSWANTGAPFATTAYLKDPLGFVHLKGRIMTGASGAIAFVLPAGFRPGATDSYAGGGITGADHADIDASGNVTPFRGGSVFAFGGITFLAEN